ncbi:MAG: carboxypeptidase-like regulatory domain-containing protein [Acidobacteriota bacterium]
MDLASPVHLGSGGFAEIGSILARKATLYRALLHLRGDCAAGLAVEMEIYRRGSKLAGHIYPVPCGTDLLLLGLDPGSYLLNIYPQDTRPSGKAQSMERASALVPLEVIDKNREFEIPLRRQTVLEAQWIPAQGMAPLPIALELYSSFEVLPGVFAPGAIVEPGKDNHFRVSVPAEPQYVRLKYQPPSIYISEIRYNGSPVRGGVLNVNSGAAANRLEVFLDNRLASVSGETTDGSRPVPNAAVLLAPESYRGEAPIQFALGKRATSDANGHFELPLVPPGDYRILAGPNAALEDPAALVDLLRSAQKLTLAPSASQSVTVRVNR